MSLPYTIPNDVKVFPNEYINSNTMNRALLRLYYNDLYLSNLSTLDPIDQPTVANSLLIATSPSNYIWMDSDQVKTTLAITDTILGLSDVDIDEIAIEHNQGIAWDATKNAFVAKSVVNTLVDLSDTLISAPTDNEVLLYSSTYGKFINGNPSNYSVGYITNIVFEESGKAVVEEIENIAGQQITITKIGIGTAAYFVPDTNNKINGEADVALRSSNAAETNASIHLRSYVKSDETIEWVTISGDGTWDVIPVSSVPGSSILSRLVTETELLLQPYNVTYDNVPDATEGIKGIIQIASDAEATAGTDIAKCITPQQLKYYFDNFAVTFASNAEFLLGTDTELSASVAQIRAMDNDYVKFTSHDTYPLAISESAGNDTEYIFDLTEFNGIDLVTSEIRTIHIYCECWARFDTAYGKVDVEYPDGTYQTVFKNVAVWPEDDQTKTSAMISIPINRNQTSFKVYLYTAGGTSYSNATIVGATQRVIY